MFSNLIKPKWQHKDPGIRKAAVDRLSLSAGNIEILSRIATEDADIDVRCAAVSRLSNVPLLQSISANDLSEKVQEAANTRLSEILMAKGQGSPPLAERIATLKEIRNNRVAECIVRDTTEPELQIAAMEYVEDLSTLSWLVVSGPSSILRQAAARRIDDHDMLQALLKSSKHHDKNVHKIVREKLATIRNKIKESSEDLSRKEHLLKSMELLSKSTYSSLYKSKYQQLLSQWSNVEGAKLPELERRFRQAGAVCQQTISLSQEKQLEQQKHVEQNRASHEELQGLYHSIEGMLDSLMQSPYDGEPTGTAIQVALDQYWGTWESVKVELLPTRQEQQRFDRASHSLSEFVAAVQRLESRLDRSNGPLEQAAALLNKEKSQQLERMQQAKSSLEKNISQIAWPGSYPPSLMLRQAGETVENLDKAIIEVKKNQGEALETAKAKLEQLSEYIDEGAAKSATGLIREIRGLVNQLGNRKTAAMGKQLAHLSHRLDELNDWKSFAATPKKEMLIKKMEGLVESDLPMQDRANLIKELENEWKSLGRGGKDKAESDELWERFKRAGDSAYEPCKKYFSDQRLLRKENLHQRKILCDELEHYVTSMNWDEADWKKVEKVVHLGRDEWKKFSPVDRSAGKQVQQRFDRLMGEINDKLNIQRKANTNIKHDLVNQMEALVECEELGAAINDAKRLQKDWQNVGITFRSDDRRLWKAFRTACDQVFDRRNQEQQVRDEERLEQFRLAEALCEKLEQHAALDLSDWDDSAIHLDEITREFNSLGPMPRESQSAIKSRFDTAVKSHRRRSEEYHKYLGAQKAADAKRLSDQCAEIEYGVMSDESQELDVQIEQLRANLAASSLDGTFISAIKSRLDTAANNIGSPDRLTSQSDENEHKLRLLCIRLEVLTETESPVEDQDLRMTYQVKRLSEGMMGTHAGADSTPGQLSEFALEWLEVGPVRREQKSELQNRWDQILAGQD